MFIFGTTVTETLLAHGTTAVTRIGIVRAYAGLTVVTATNSIHEGVECYSIPLTPACFRTAETTKFRWEMAVPSAGLICLVTIRGWAKVVNDCLSAPPNGTTQDTVFKCGKLPP